MVTEGRHSAGFTTHPRGKRLGSILTVTIPGPVLSTVVIQSQCQTAIVYLFVPASLGEFLIECFVGGVKNLLDSGPIYTLFGLIFRDAMQYVVIGIQIHMKRDFIVELKVWPDVFEKTLWNDVLTENDAVQRALYSL